MLHVHVAPGGNLGRSSLEDGQRRLGGGAARVVGAFGVRVFYAAVDHQPGVAG